MRELYNAEIEYLDRQLGLLFARLDELGVVDKTVVVITSDHGENFGDHGLIEHQLCVYNSLIRVPLILRYRRLLRPERSSERFATVGLGSAVLLLTEMPGNDDHVGWLNHQVASCGRREAYYAEYENPERMLRDTLGKDADRIGIGRFDRSLKSIVKGDFKLIEGSDGRSELYDLTVDFNEQRNLAALRAEVVDELRATLEEWWTSLPHSDPAASTMFPLDDELRDRLEALGYAANPEVP